jgi:hypothetical protein
MLIYSHLVFCYEELYHHDPVLLPPVFPQTPDYVAKLKLNSLAVVRKRTIPTERPPLVGEVSANLCG